MIGILAVQGAFAEQEKMFRNAGAQTFEIRQRADLDRPMKALVLPGGESTVQGKLLKELGLFEPLRERILKGLPVFATCAGLILLAEKLVDDPTVWFGILPITVKRNAYGRQLGSFSYQGQVFIRAPGIMSLGEGIEVISTFQGKPTGVHYKNITALAWHPELTDDLTVVKRFLAKI